MAAQRDRKLPVRDLSAGPLEKYRDNSRRFPKRQATDNNRRNNRANEIAHRTDAFKILHFRSKIAGHVRKVCFVRTFAFGSLFLKRNFPKRSDNHFDLGVVKIERKVKRAVVSNSLEDRGEAIGLLFSNAL